MSGSLWCLLYEVTLLAKELLQGQYRKDGWEAKSGLNASLSLHCEWQGNQQKPS